MSTKSKPAGGATPTAGIGSAFNTTNSTTSPAYGAETVDRKARYRARLSERGLVQVAVWVPADKKAELLRLVRELCAEGVTRDAASEPVARDTPPPVARDTASEPVATDTASEPVASDAPPPVTRDAASEPVARDAKRARDKANRERLHAERAQQFATASEYLEIESARGSRARATYRAAVLSREIKHAFNFMGPSVPRAPYTEVRLLVQQGQSYRVVSAYEFSDRTVFRPREFAYVGTREQRRREEEQRWRRVARDNHPDRNPDGDVALYQQAIEALHRMREAGR